MMRLLWFLGFRPQVITPCGFIADWYNSRALVIVELDGAPHFTKIGFSADRKRDRYHRAKGILTIRFTNRVALQRRGYAYFKVLYLSVVWQLLGWLRFTNR
jgi:very-short-patch-repair endonuclease